MSQKATTAMLAAALLLGGLWGVLFALWTRNPWLLPLVGGLSLAGLLQLFRKRRNLAFSGALALLIVGVDGVTYAFVPSVTFLVAAKAFPGHMVVEFRSDCPGSIRRSVPLKIEYVVPVSGYACSSTPLPEYLNAHFILYDPDPSVRKSPPRLAGGSFFATGTCGGASTGYVHKELAEEGTGVLRKGWHDFAQRVNFRCR
jgi:hypothetical protein